MAINAPTSYTAEGAYSAEWASIYALYFPPEIWQEWYERYGGGFKVLDWINMAGRTFQVADREFYHFEDGTDLRVATVGVGGIPTTAAGGDATGNSVLAATDYDANGNGPLREHFTVLIPADYTNQTVDQLWVVTAKAGVGAAQTYQITPLTQAQMTVPIPENTELAIGPSIYAPGMGQPEGMTTGTYKRTHSTQITKETFELEGGQHAKRNYREVITKAGKPGIFDRATVETEFRLDRAQDFTVFIGEDNTNTGNLQQTSHFGGTNDRLGTQGIWTWANQLAQSKTYIGDFDMDDFDDVKPLLQSQGVMDATVMFLYGSNLGLSVENTVLDGGLKEWSAGTDLLREDFFRVNFKQVMKNGVNFKLKECVSFANPATFGNDTYDYTNSGLIFPISDVSVTTSKGEKKSMPNLAIGYLNHKGEDRTRIIGPVAGPNGLGYPFSNQYDGIAMYMLTEFAVFAANVNQWIQVTKS